LTLMLMPWRPRRCGVQPRFGTGGAPSTLPGARIKYG